MRLHFVRSIAFALFTAAIAAPGCVMDGSDPAPESSAPAAATEVVDEASPEVPLAQSVNEQDTKLETILSCSNYTSTQCGINYCPHHRVDYHYSCKLLGITCVCSISSKSCYPWIGC
jgi:hypothetical protein